MLARGHARHALGLLDNISGTVRSPGNSQSHMYCTLSAPDNLGTLSLKRSEANQRRPERSARKKRDIPAIYMRFYLGQSSKGYPPGLEAAFTFRLSDLCCLSCSSEKKD
eukprot:365451-Chlamydomonas_euryale.AAC.8